MSGRRHGSPNDVPSEKATSEQSDAQTQRKSMILDNISIVVYFKEAGKTNEGEETQRNMRCKTIESAREFFNELETTTPDVPSDDESGGGQK